MQKLQKTTQGLMMDCRCCQTANVQRGKVKQAGVKFMFERSRYEFSLLVS